MSLSHGGVRVLCGYAQEPSYTARSPKASEENRFPAKNVRETGSDTDFLVQAHFGCIELFQTGLTERDRILAGANKLARL